MFEEIEKAVAIARKYNVLVHNDYICLGYNTFVKLFSAEETEVLGGHKGHYLFMIEVKAVHNNQEYHAWFLEEEYEKWKRGEKIEH